MKNVLLALCLLNQIADAQSIPQVKIGTQIWMTKNLDVDHFRNGDLIPQAKTDEDWKRAGKNKQPAWCYYGNDSLNGVKYGRLYNWYAVTDKRRLAPVGYHIPSDQEWTILSDYLGRKEIAGKKMKTVSGWNKQDGWQIEGNNESGFSGLPGGYRYSNCSFSNVLGFYGCWWSTTEYYGSAWSRELNHDDDMIRRYTHSPVEGLSVRCIKD